MNGILSINKPGDMTSFGVVAQVKHLTRERKVGHAGTLDPQATGVLPICLGQATRIIEYLFDESKAYRAEIELGVTTDTYDSSGKICRTEDSSDISREMVESALSKFRGNIQQIPPMYSAIKHRGKPLYKLARSGVEVERKSRQVRVDRLEIAGWQPPVVILEAVCGKGTYIRSLAYDLGEELGCGANLKSLIRIRVGPFSLVDALTLTQLEEASRLGHLGKHLYPVDYVLSNFRAVTVNEEQQGALIHGSSVSLHPGAGEESPGITDGTLSRAYSRDGRFLAMVRYNAASHQWHPEKIFLQDA